jgi:uncharacterized membrane protein
MRMLAVLGFVLAAACQPAGEPEPAAAVTPAAVAVPDPAPVVEPAGVVIGGVDFSAPVRALGTEPFWGVEITPRELVVSGVDRPEMRVANPGVQMQGDAAVIAAGDQLTITLRDVDCSDGMSDRVYALEAEVKLGAETLKGCADSQATLDAQPRP